MSTLSSARSNIASRMRHVIMFCCCCVLCGCASSRSDTQLGRTQTGQARAATSAVAPATTASADVDIGALVHVDFVNKAPANSPSLPAGHIWILQGRGYHLACDLDGPAVLVMEGAAPIALRETTLRRHALLARRLQPPSVWTQGFNDSTAIATTLNYWPSDVAAHLREASAGPIKERWAEIANELLAGPIKLQGHATAGPALVRVELTEKGRRELEAALGAAGGGQQ